MPIQWETKQSTGTVRQIAKCVRCKKVRSRVVKWTNTRTYRDDMIGCVSNHTRYEGETAVDCCERQLHFRNVKGVFNPAKKCGGKCLNASGPSCECSCSGKNHGAGHAASQEGAT
jgi:hypothetical protein